MGEIFSWMFSVEGWVALGTLALLEVVLGIDNVIFVSIAASKLPKETRGRARSIGLFLAMFLRIALLTVLTLLASLTKPLFQIFGHGVSGRDLILMSGGIYLVYKAAIEIDEMVRVKEFSPHSDEKKSQASFMGVIAQIAIVDVVFAIDSIITAVGMTNHLPVMIAAVVMAVFVMMFASGIVSEFIERNPSTKMLALAFLFAIGLVLIADGIGFHIERSYIYAIVIFSIFVETLNIWARRAIEREAMSELTHTNATPDEDSDEAEGE